MVYTNNAAQMTTDGKCGHFSITHGVRLADGSVLSTKYDVSWCMRLGVISWGIYEIGYASPLRTGKLIPVNAQACGTYVTDSVLQSLEMNCRL